MDIELIFDPMSEVGESPVWDAEQETLWWVDLLKGELHRWRQSEGCDLVCSLGKSLGFVVPSVEGGFIAGTGDGLGILDAEGRFRLVVPMDIRKQGFRINDGKCDVHGRLWFGTMSDETHQGGCLYVVRDNWGLELVRQNMGVPNGMGWSPDGETMYLADTGARQLEIWRYDPGGGSLVDLQVVVSFGADEGGPDGLTVDRDGCVWVCLWGGHGLRRYAPDGTLLESLQLPALNAASCTFGGPSFVDLYITTARYGLTPSALADWPGSGGVYRCRPAVGGLPVDTFVNAS